MQLKRKTLCVEEKSTHKWLTGKSICSMFNEELISIAHKELL